MSNHVALSTDDTAIVRSEPQPHAGAIVGAGQHRGHGRALRRSAVRTAIPTDRSTPPAVRVCALLAACLASLAVGFAGEIGWLWLAVHGLKVPNSLSSLQWSSLVISAVVPVAGNGLGYFMVYRQKRRRATLMFVAPGVLLTGVGMVVSLARLPGSLDAREALVTAVLALITPVATMAILLARTDLQRVPRLNAAQPGED